LSFRPVSRQGEIAYGRLKSKKDMKRKYNFYVYIMASLSGTLYVGFTNDLLRRVWEHREGKIEGFTKKYSCKKLIYYEQYNDVYAAMNREKEIKKWRREKKQNLIKTINPRWNDLYKDLVN
jgi:putative endonuclease